MPIGPLPVVPSVIDVPSDEIIVTLPAVVLAV